MKSQSVALLIVAVGAAWIGRSLFPRTEQVIVPPRIETHWDTVRVIDTAWVTRLVERTKWDTVYLERVVHAAPETLRVCPDVRGITALEVAGKVGDSTVARGFRLTRRDSLVLWEDWQTQWWTAGPLRAVSLDSFPPRVAFWPAPKEVKPCGTMCKLLHYGTGFGIGRASCSLIP